MPAVLDLEHEVRLRERRVPGGIGAGQRLEAVATMTGHASMNTEADANALHATLTFRDRGQRFRRLVPLMA